MSVARKELCQALFELSGWDDWRLDKHLSLEAEAAVQEGRRVFEAADGRITSFDEAHSYRNGYWAAPKYDLDYLLRQIEPAFVSLTRYGEGWEIHASSGDAMWELKVQHLTPEDAAAATAIELFRGGYLVREDHS